MNRAEPTYIGWIEKLPGCVELFQQAGWLDFFKRIDGYNAEVSCRFAQCYKDYMVVFDTLKFRITVDLVAEATWIRDEGEKWFKKMPFTFDAQKYLLPNVTPNWNKGILIQKFRREWVEPIRILQSYITCEGRYAFVYKYHFRFLQHMVGVSKMSLPFFLYKILQKMSNRVKGHIDHSSQSISHHGLIKLIISTALQDEGKTWYFFLFWSGFSNETRRSTNQEAGR